MPTRNTETWENGVLVSTGTIEITQAEENEENVYTKARQALTANGNFLALSSPTNAQTLAQVKLLTREVNGLIRLLLRELEDVTDT